MTNPVTDASAASIQNRVLIRRSPPVRIRPGPIFATSRGRRQTRCVETASVRRVVTLDEVRAFARELPRSYEAVVRGRVKFRIGRIVYVAFSRDETEMGFGFPKEWREALVESEPEKFFMPSAGDLRYNWAEVRLAAIDADEMRELVLDAWAMVVPQSVADAWAAAQPAGD
jgi:hypothetical protein